GARSTLLLTSASLKALTPERIRADRDADAARMAFNRLLGRSIDAPLELDTTVTLEPPPVRVSRSALDDRPDLEAIRLQKETLKGYARVYRLQYLPAIGVQGTVGIMAYELGEQLTDFDRSEERRVENRC